MHELNSGSSMSILFFTIEKNCNIVNPDLKLYIYFFTAIYVTILNMYIIPFLPHKPWNWD